nr:DUF3383 family protein [Xylella fastidiosa]
MAGGCGAKGGVCRPASQPDEGAADGCRHPPADRGLQKVCQEGVRNGAFAPGLWNGEAFGALATGDYLEAGFYVWADSVDTLSTSDRQARRAPPLQIAVKLAGAIHAVDVIINFDR